MTKADALQALSGFMPDLGRQFGVRSLAVFGSVARDVATDASDLDLLIEFDAPATLHSYMGTKFFIEDRLGVRVDLATKGSIRPRMRPNVERDAVRVA